MARLIHPHARRTGWSGTALAWTATLLALLWASGLLLYLWPAEALMELAPAQVLLRRVALLVHGTGVWLLCMFAGRWIWPHAQIVWRRKRTGTWVLGIAMASMLLAVAATGMLLLYGPADSHDGASALHWWVAVGLPLLFAAHGWRRFGPRRHHGPRGPGQ
ncbi:hypothetical protein HHL11_23445 [Ramlibacter sp. G-1-2-2]|uniref:DUF4405 domain-containing protein n=1 Tax=Ramlibacter agri TaxID=2728837 RepID=A0A848HGE1_9BURK|nr:hypothetical protein [Ramlibacter agri]NML46718.1 hypothetical protein [Ramlibacter agri]